MQKKQIIFLISAVIIVTAFYFFTNNQKVVAPNSNEAGVNTDLVTNKEVEDVNKLKDNNKKIMQATLKTNKGEITIELDTTNTPKTSENFIKLAKEGFYNGTKFHRVIKDFMIQGGDPLTKDNTKMDYWGTGGPGYKFADEITPLNKNMRGTISMANSGPNTNGSQFFINTKDNNFLDTKHTVFGKVISGMDTVEKIEAAQTVQNDRPKDEIVINSIDLK